MTLQEVKEEISREYLAAKNKRLGFQSEMDDAKKLAVLDPYFDIKAVEVSFNIFLQREKLYHLFLTYLDSIEE
jgi:hypothetical protein